MAKPNATHITPLDLQLIVDIAEEIRAGKYQATTTDAARLIAIIGRLADLSTITSIKAGV